MIDLAKILKNIRISSGRSQADFAGILGVPQTTWSGYERGETKPKLPVLIALKAKGFDVPGVPDDVFQEIIKEGQMLDEAGKIRPDYLNKSEPIERSPTNVNLKIPLLRQKVSCGPGENWEAEQNIKEYIDIFGLIPRIKPGRMFALSVQGNSMVGAGIKNGDYVLFNAETDQHLSDDIYVFALDGEVYCKQLEFDGISKRIKIYSLRVADLEKAELLITLNIEDTDFVDRFRIFGRVISWVHPNLGEN